MISINELRMKHQYGALIHEELTTLINDADIEVRIEARKLAKELDYIVISDNWNTSKVCPSKGLTKAFSKLI